MTLQRCFWTAPLAAFTLLGCDLSATNLGDCESGPVCGSDGVTYASTCEVDTARVSVAHAGSCGGDCACPALESPVCGEDGVTYGSACEARCAGVATRAPGACPSACTCPDLWQPLCGTDGLTYANGCEVRCAGAEVAYEGECTTSCPDVVDTVCALDGLTYSNPCLADAYGIGVAYWGPCTDSCRDTFCAWGYRPGTCGCIFPGDACTADSECGSNGLFCLLYYTGGSAATGGTSGLAAGGADSSGVGAAASGTGGSPADFIPPQISGTCEPYSEPATGGTTSTGGAPGLAEAGGAGATLPD